VTERPDILFIPVSGRTGLGEYARCLAVAQAARRRWPEARTRFILNRQAPYAASAPVECHLVDGSPTFNTERVNELIRSDPPGVVVFDNAGRVAQLKCAVEAGARTVFISARPRKRRKALRPAWLRRLDQHWIVQPASLTLALSIRERLVRALLKRPEMLLVHGIFPEPDAAQRERFKSDLGLDGEPYVLFTPGGGGHRVQGRSSAETFAEAAAGVAAETGLRAVVVMGPLYSEQAPRLRGVTVLPSIGSQDMANLIHDARALAIGGGGTLVQALSMGKACVAVPTGGRDQPRRIRELQRRGAIVTSPLDPKAISGAMVSLLQDPARLSAAEARARALGIRNGLSQALAALGSLLVR
jgi:hypothetical protein